METLTKKNIWLILIILFCLTVHAEQAEQSKQELQFVISNDQEVLNILWDKYPEISKPSYIAVIRFKNAIRFPESQNITTSEYFGIAGIDPDGLRTYTPTDVLIRCVLRDNRELTQPLEFTIKANHKNPRSRTFEEYIIFANSEQQARELTETFIKLCNDSASENLEKLKKDIEKMTKVMTQLEAEKPLLEIELEKLRETTKVKIEEYAKANYSTQDETSIYKLTEKHTQELADLLRNVNFDLAGLDAKINSINTYKKSEVIIDDETIIKLNQILISTDIERAGAIARKQAYETAFNQANELYNLLSRKYKVVNILKELPVQISAIKSNINKLERDLENLIPVEVEDNKVIIRPVKQD